MTVLVYFVNSINTEEVWTRNWKYKPITPDQTLLLSYLLSKVEVTWVMLSLCRQEDYFFGKCFNVMEVDALNSSHPVSTPVVKPAQIREMFDEVSYEKVKMDNKGTFWTPNC